MLWQVLSAKYHTYASQQPFKHSRNYFPLFCLNNLSSAKSDHLGRVQRTRWKDSGAKAEVAAGGHAEPPLVSGRFVTCLRVREGRAGEPANPRKIRRLRI